MLLFKLGSDFVYDNVNSTVGFMVSYLDSSVKYYMHVVADDSFHCSQQHLILRSSNLRQQLSSGTMSSKNHKEVHGNKRLVANTASMEQRSKYQNELTKKKRIGDYPKEPNWQQGVSGCTTTPSQMGTPSATQDPLIDTESYEDVSSSVVATRRMAPVDDTINNFRMQMDDMVPYHKFLIAQTSKYMTN